MNNQSQLSHKNMNTETKNKPFIKMFYDLLENPNLTSTRKLVYAYILSRGNIEGWTFNATDISKRLGISYKTAIREIKELESTNEIKYVGYKKIGEITHKKYEIVELGMGQNVPIDTITPKVSSESGQNVQSESGQNVQSESGQNVQQVDIKKKDIKKVDIKKVDIKEITNNKELSINTGKTEELTPAPNKINEIIGLDSVVMVSRVPDNKLVETFESMFTDNPMSEPDYVGIPSRSSINIFREHTPMTNKNGLQSLPV